MSCYVSSVGTLSMESVLDLNRIVIIWLKISFDNELNGNNVCIKIISRPKVLAPPLAPPPATRPTHPSNHHPVIPHPSPCRSSQHPAIPRPVRHRRTRSWAWEEKCSRPFLRVTTVTIVMLTWRLCLVMLMIVFFIARLQKEFKKRSPGGCRLYNQHDVFTG